MPNRFMLAPLTNLQSHDDGTLSEDEYRWLRMRAQGGFGLVMTCAAHVQPEGQGFPGQLGVYSDAHIAGLSRLASAINHEGSLSVIQLHHAGLRSPKTLTNRTPVAPSNFEERELKARALEREEIEKIISDFIEAAVRSKKAGFKGVEIHGAHSYLLCQFLSKTHNKRTDAYGGSLKNRMRIFFEILTGIRQKCSSDFLVGVRLSPENYGLDLHEMLEVSQALIDSGHVDFLDISLWDVKKHPSDISSELRLIDFFSRLNWGEVKFVVAGKIYDPNTALWCLNKGADFVALGKAGIIHHNYPEMCKSDVNFTPHDLPVSVDHLVKEGLGPNFIDYLANRWKNFVKRD